MSMSDGSRDSVISVDFNKKLTTIRQKKKQATMDGQLLINRIALLQKEEERARKKIVETTEKASEVLQMREHNVSRLKKWDVLTTEDIKAKREMQLKFKREEEQARVNRSRKVQSIHEKRWELALEVKNEKEQIIRAVVEDNQRDLQMKRRMREEVRAQQEQARMRRERERLEQERKIREHHDKVLQAEMEEAKRAEILVRELERKEQEWISRLRTTQTIQETAFEHLEAALLLDDGGGGSSPHLKSIKERSPSAPKPRSSSSTDSRKKDASGGSKSKRY